MVEPNEISQNIHNITSKKLHWMRDLSQKAPSRKCDHVVRYGDNLGGVFALAIRVSYPMEVKMQAIKMRLAGVPV